MKIYIFMFFLLYFHTSHQHSRRVQKLVDEPYRSTRDGARKYSATLMKARLNVIFVFPCVVSVSQLIKATLTWKVARPRDIQLLCFTPDSYLLYSLRLTWTEDEGAGRLLSRQNKQRNRNIWWHSGSHVQPVSLSVESKWLGFCFLSIWFPFKVIFLGLLTQKCIHICNCLVLCRLYIYIRLYIKRQTQNDIHILCGPHNIQ